MEQRSIDFYIKKAKYNSGIQSDRQLGNQLGLSSNAISQFNTYRAHPSPDTMIKLAKLAEIDPAVALIDLATWTSEGETRQTYASILQKIQAVFLIGTVFFAFAPSPATAKVSNDKPVYVYYGNCRKFIKYISKVLQSFKNCALGLSNRYEREYLKA